ncbi:MAG TPA: phage integrase N-terminal SAM-like domain-containing protein [Rubricoccaceae bacterium]
MSALLDDVRQAVRLRHMSYRTERTDPGWITRFVRFHAARAGTFVHPPRSPSPMSRRS